MRTMTTTKTVYKFSELDERQQDKAIDKLYDINVDHEWWDCIYEDAATIGLKLTEFALDRNRHAEGKFTESPLTVINLIKDNHGPDCETFKTAESFELTFKMHKIALDYDIDNEGDDDYVHRFCEVDFEDASGEFLTSLLEDYAIMLQKEYEYLSSRESIVETINCNEYEFDENGNLA